MPERFRSLCGPDMTGDSVITDPRGEVTAGPAQGETILVAEVSLEAVLAAKAVCDVAGHYARPDLFQVRVDGEQIGRVMPAQAEAVRRAGALGQSHPHDARAGPGGAGKSSGKSMTLRQGISSARRHMTSSTRPSSAPGRPRRPRAAA